MTAAAWRRAGLGILLTAGALAAGCREPPAPREGGPAAMAPREDAPRTVPAAVAARLQVTVAAVRPKPLRRTIDLIGRVAFDEDRAALAGPRLGGRIVRLAARPGETVERGAVLAELESVELARAAAEYLGLKARARAAASNARRERELARRRITSERELETAVAEEETLAAEVAAREQLLLALGLGGDELPDTGSDRPLARFSVRAPIAGIVTERPVVAGQSVDGAQTIARIADLSHVWVYPDVFERDLAWVRPGLTATLGTEAFPGDLLEARVRYVAPEIDPTTRTAKVRLDVPSPGGRLRPGHFVTARLTSEEADTGPVLAVPRSAVQTLDGRPVVFARLPDGSFAVPAVALGAEVSEEVEVREGLAAGDEVAVDNTFLLKSEVLR